MKGPGRRLASAFMAATAGLVLAAAPAYAPEREKPKKITVDEVIWNSQAEAFEISFRLAFGPAVGADAARFGLVTTPRGDRGDQDRARRHTCCPPDPDASGVRRTDGVVLLTASLPGEAQAAPSAAPWRSA